jgi:RIO-like serine/threonine protein kinase
VFESVRLSELPELRRRVLRRPSSTRPALWLIEKGGVRAVVKDYSLNGFLYRHTVGRFLIWREGKAYRRLKGLEGVPDLYGVINGLALVMEEIPGSNMEGLENDRQLSEGFFRSLRVLVDRIHGRGLAHCDLKRAPNILMGRDGKPYIVDWSAAISEREFPIFPLNKIYQRFLQDDLNAIMKLRLKHCPAETISSEEKRLYYRRGVGERLVRRLRDRAREWLQRIA